MGYKNGSWEFNYDTKSIHNSLQELTLGKGVLHLNLHEGWRVSDDTVMHLATAEALATELEGDALLDEIALKYVECFNDMEGRAPGVTTYKSILHIRKNRSWSTVPFSPSGGGCGGSMRSSCIGLLYYRESDFDKLLSVSIEAGRMTHNHPTGYLGSFASALFTSYAIRGIEPVYWASMLLDNMDNVREYITEKGRDVEKNLTNMDYFINAFKDYITLRNLPRSKISHGDQSLELKSSPYFPEKYHELEVHDKFINDVSFSGWGGSSGHDSVLIAYDTILYAKEDWEKICMYGILHGGDNDSTGTICGSLYGAMHGFNGIPPGHYQHIEYASRLTDVAKKIYRRANPE